TEGVVPAPSPPFPPGTFLPKGFVIPPDPSKGTKIPVYNIEPKDGEPALFRFVVGFEHLLFLETQVTWQGDFHESFTTHEPEPERPFTPLKNRLVSFGQEAGNMGAEEAGNGTFITNPTTCVDPNQFPHLYSTWLRAESWGEPNPTFPTGSTSV